MILDILALVSVLTAPVLFLIDLDERRLDRHFDQAVEVGNSWRKSSN
jgi:hypothetical protein